jgi:DNA-binding PadR family transcriptional regulator
MPPLPNTSPQTRRVLDVLLAEPEVWHYGYDLSRRTGLKSGTLYPLLLRLADQGWLETRWLEPERPGRPPRHTYRLTAEGTRSAAALPTRKATSRRALRLRGATEGG